MEIEVTQSEMKHQARMEQEGPSVIERFEYRAEEAMRILLLTIDACAEAAKSEILDDFEVLDLAHDLAIKCGRECRRQGRPMPASFASDTALLNGWYWGFHEGYEEPFPELCEEEDEFEEPEDRSDERGVEDVASIFVTQGVLSVFRTEAGKFGWVIETNCGRAAAHCQSEHYDNEADAMRAGLRVDSLRFPKNEAPTSQSDFFDGEPEECGDEVASVHVSQGVLTVFCTESGEFGWVIEADCGRAVAHCQGQYYEDEADAMRAGLSVDSPSVVG